MVIVYERQGHSVRFISGCGYSSDIPNAVQWWRFRSLEIYFFFLSLLERRNIWVFEAKGFVSHTWPRPAGGLGQFWAHFELNLSSESMLRFWAFRQSIQANTWCHWSEFQHPLKYCWLSSFAKFSERVFTTLLPKYFRTVSENNQTRRSLGTLFSALCWSEIGKSNTPYCCSLVLMWVGC